MEALPVLVGSVSGPRRRRRPGQPSRAGQRERVEIESIAAGGEGVGRLGDGRAVFVHRTAPGDLVEVAVTTDRERWARARLVQVARSGPDRRDAPCVHYADCGGCTVEHLTYEAQLRVKGRIVADALRRIGGFEVELPEVVPSPREFRYRNRVSFALRRAGRGELFAGFHTLRDPDRIHPVDGACLLPEEPIAEAWDRIRASWGPDANRLPSGERLRLTLRGTFDGSVSLLVEGGNSPGRPEELIESVAGLDSIWWRPTHAPAQLIGGSSGLTERWGGESLEIGGAAFLQVNRWAAAYLEDHVLELAGDVAGLAVVDAYCGVGLHARRLSRAGATVTGIELDPDAVRIAAEEGSAGDRFLHGHVEEMLPDALPADLVILNPPRAGIESAAADALLNRPPGRIIFVSCDPATLARDLKRLGSGFSLGRLKCFDLFPQTAHVETVVELVRTGSIRDAEEG
jgi:23S rRNA (uracil1939-C5)-methyltransferase